MTSSVILDDEFKSRASLEILLVEYSENIEVIALCQNVAEAIEAIHNHSSDLFFLDTILK